MPQGAHRAANTGEVVFETAFRTASQGPDVTPMIENRSPRAASRNQGEVEAAPNASPPRMTRSCEVPPNSSPQRSSLSRSAEVPPHGGGVPRSPSRTVFTRTDVSPGGTGFTGSVVEAPRRWPPSAEVPPASVRGLPGRATGQGMMISSSRRSFPGRLMPSPSAVLAVAAPANSRSTLRPRPTPKETPAQLSTPRTTLRVAQI